MWLEILLAAVLSTKSMALVWTAAENGILPAVFLGRDIQSFRGVHSAACFNMLWMGNRHTEIGFPLSFDARVSYKEREKAHGDAPPERHHRQHDADNGLEHCVRVYLCPHVPSREAVRRGDVKYR